MNHGLFDYADCFKHSKEKKISQINTNDLLYYNGTLFVNCRTTGTCTQIFICIDSNKVQFILKINCTNQKDA